MFTNLVGKLSRKLTAGLAMLALSGAALAAFPVAAFAEGDTPPAAETPAAGERAGMTLEHLYQREQTSLGIQADHLNGAGDIAGKVQTWIDKLAGNGQDVSDLQAALASFNASVASAQSDHDSAARILSAHAGFDSQGKVTDMQAAKETVRSAGEALRDCRRTLLEAAHDLRQAIRNWRQSHRPSPSSSGVPGAAPTLAG